MRFGIWMLVGIFEKSRRVRTARNSFWLVESDMSSPVARPRVVGPVAWLEGPPRRSWEGEENAGQTAPSAWTSLCAHSGMTVLVTGHAQGALYCSPRSILRGPNLMF